MFSFTLNPLLVTSVISPQTYIFLLFCLNDYVESFLKNVRSSLLNKYFSISSSWIFNILQLTCLGFILLYTFLHTFYLKTNRAEMDRKEDVCIRIKLIWSQLKFACFQLTRSPYRFSIPNSQMENRQQRMERSLCWPKLKTLFNFRPTLDIPSWWWDISWQTIKMKNIFVRNMSGTMAMGWCSFFTSIFDIYNRITLTNLVSLLEVRR